MYVERRDAPPRAPPRKRRPPTDLRPHLFYFKLWAVRLIRRAEHRVGVLEVEHARVRLRREPGERERLGGLRLVGVGGALARDASSGMRETSSIVTLSLCILAFCMLVELPAVARKCLLSFSAVGVLVALRARDDLAILGVFDAICRGTACALVGAVLPFPRTATERANDSLRAAAAGLTLSFEAYLAPLVRGARRPAPSRQTERWLKLLAG